MVGFGTLVASIPNAINGFFAWLNKKQDVDIEKYKVDGKLSEALVAAALASREGWTAADRAMLWIFAYPLGAWWTLALANSGLRDLMGWQWKVHTFPLVEQWGWAIVGYLFFASFKRS